MFLDPHRRVEAVRIPQRSIQSGRSGARARASIARSIDVVDRPLRSRGRRAWVATCRGRDIRPGASLISRPTIVSRREDRRVAVSSNVTGSWTACWKNGCARSSEERPAIPPAPPLPVRRLPPRSIRSFSHPLSSPLAQQTLPSGRIDRSRVGGTPFSATAGPRKSPFRGMCRGAVLGEDGFAGSP